MFTVRHGVELGSRYETHLVVALSSVGISFTLFLYFSIRRSTLGVPRAQTALDDGFSSFFRETDDTRGTYQKPARQKMPLEWATSRSPNIKTSLGAKV